MRAIFMASSFRCVQSEFGASVSSSSDAMHVKMMVASPKSTMWDASSASVRTSACQCRSGVHTRRLCEHRQPAQPRLRRDLRGHQLDLLRESTPPTRRPSWRPPPPMGRPEPRLRRRARRRAGYRGGGREALQHALQGPPRGLPQVVIAMAVTREGSRCGAGRSPATPPTRASSAPSRTTSGGGGVSGGVGGRPRVRPAANRAYLTRGGGHYIHAEKLRAPHQDPRRLARAGRYRRWPGTSGQGGRASGTVSGPSASWSATTPRRPRATPRCARTSSPTCEQIDGSDAWPQRRRDELVGTLRTSPGLRRFLRRTKAGAAAPRPGRRSARGAPGRQVAAAHLRRDPDRRGPGRRLQAALPGRARLARHEGGLGLRPVFHHREDRIRAHVQLCWLALLLIRVVENTTGETWRCVRDELERMHLVTLETAEGRVAQRSRTTPGQRRILAALELPEPPRSSATSRSARRSLRGRASGSP